MGWGHCGTDSKGREIGYCIEATCDHPGCEAKIDRGLSYACGGMHGTNTLPATDFHPCEGYFCDDHMKIVDVEGECLGVCHVCYVEALEIENERLQDLVQEQKIAAIPDAILDIKLRKNDAKAETLRQYLVKLLAMLWREEECFDGKRPFGNSGWQWDVYRDLVEQGHVQGTIDQYGDLEMFDELAARGLVVDAIHRLR